MKTQRDTDSAESYLREKYSLGCMKNIVRIYFKKQAQSVYLSMFSISVPTSHCSCRKSMGEEDRSSRMGTSELSSILKSTFGSESVPSGPNTDSSRETQHIQNNLESDGWFLPTKEEILLLSNSKVPSFYNPFSVSHSL